MGAVSKDDNTCTKITMATSAPVCSVGDINEEIEDDSEAVSLYFTLYILKPGI